MALQGKWKWRMLNDGEAVWADLLRFRYGHIPSLLLGDQASSYGSNSSIWWRDVISSNRLPVENWFKSNVRCRVGNGNNIGFWKFKWYGNQPLCELFPDLFAKKVSKDVLVAERLDGSGDELIWRWQWCDSLFIA
jgi:hypothetical protein